MPGLAGHVPCNECQATAQGIQHPGFWQAAFGPSVFHLLDSGGTEGVVAGTIYLEVQSGGNYKQQRKNVLLMHTLMMITRKVIILSRCLYLHKSDTDVRERTQTKQMASWSFLSWTADGYEL